MQVVLLSLDIYNDVHCSAVPALAAQHLAGEAQADAELCMRKLIANLATEVSAVSGMHSVLIKVMVAALNQCCLPLQSVYIYCSIFC